MLNLNYPYRSAANNAKMRITINFALIKLLYNESYASEIFAVLLGVLLMRCIVLLFWLKDKAATVMEHTVKYRISRR